MPRLPPTNPLVRHLLAVVLLAIPLLACEGESKNDQQGPQAHPVTTAIVEAESLRETVRGIGSLRALEHVEVRPESSGIVREVLFEEGAEVERGHVLYRIDSEMLARRLRAQRAALAASEARLQNAQSTMRRRAQLFADGVIAPAEYELAYTQLEQSKAEVSRVEAEMALVREQIADTVVRSPLAGIVSESRVDPGSFVTVGQHLATVYRRSPLEVEFSLPERFAARVKPGQPVQLSVASLGDQTLEGSVVFISPSVSEASRDLRAKARVPDPPPALKPGMFATVTVTLDTRENPVVPEEALVGTRKGYIVFVVEGKTAKRRAVKVGLREPGRAEVREGLETGDVVVRTGHINIEDGSKVKVVEDETKLGALGDTGSGDR